MRTVFLTVGLVLLGAGGALTLQDAASSSGTATVSLAASQDDAQAARRRGPRGRRGPAGFGQIQVVKGPSVNLSPVGSGTGTSEATCPGGTKVVGGGWEMPGVGGDPRVTAVTNHAVGSDWVVAMANTGGTVVSFNAEAMCARRGR